MLDNEKLCQKITEIYPDIGECGIDIVVNRDDLKKVWIVDLKKDGIELKHHLEYNDADKCMEGKQCVSLGLEIAQLKKNITRQQF
jgi:hypothetical protein